MHPHFLEAVLHAHGSLHLACDYLSSLSDTEVPPPPQNVRTHHLQPPQLDLSHPEASQVLANLKDIVIPALSSQLTGSTIPPLCGETDRVKYSLSGLQVTSFDLDSENVTTEIQSDTSVAIRATDASLNVSTDSWAYRMRFPPLRDTGSANFSCAGITAIVNVRFEDSAIRVTECVCTVDRVNFRTIDARLSWLYNSLAPVVRGALRRAVENAMNEAIRDALEEQLGEWANWTGGDATQF